MISTEEKLLKERIQHLLSFKKVSVASISDSESGIVKHKQMNANHQVRLKTTKRTRHLRNDGIVDNAAEARTIHKLLYMFPDVDANWLILGEGQMKKTTDRPQIFNQQQYQMQTGENNSGVINFSENSVPVPVQMLLNEKDKRIAELESDKKQLQGLLSVLTSNAQSLGPKPKKQ